MTGALAVLVGFVVLYQGVITKLIHDWATDDNYSHGFVVAPLAVYFAYERRDALKAAVQKPTVLGLAIIVGSLATLVAGTLGAELFLTRVSLIGVLAGGVLFVWGWQHARILLFPLSFLLLMVPIPAILFNQIAFPLQLLASRFGEWTLQLASIPVLREGNVMILANTTLEVAEACSGIRSMVSLVTLAIVLSYFSDARAWMRIGLTLAAIPVAILANGIRVAGTGIAAHYYGPAAADGFLHSFSGWIVFVIAFAMLFVIQRAFLLLVPAKSPAAASLSNEAVA